jgi:hypothetical protein
LRPRRNTNAMKKRGDSEMKEQEVQMEEGGEKREE